MGHFRFRRRFRIAPGFALNVGKRATSLSIGGRGAHITIGGRRARATVGIPGTGLSYTEQTSLKRRRPVRRRHSWLLVGLLLAVLYFAGKYLAS